MIGAYRVKPSTWEATRIGAIMTRTDHCQDCKGGRLVPALGCACDGDGDGGTCTPTIAVCMGSGVPDACPIGR